MASYLKEIENYIPKLKTINEEVSHKGVDWHLDHTLKVINGINKTLQNSDPSEYKSNFSFLRTVFLTFNFLPRGKGKAPSRVLPPAHISEEDLRTQLEQAYTSLQNNHDVPQKAYFKHPMFGMMPKKMAIKFIALHTRHHLKIIRDILK